MKILRYKKRRDGMYELELETGKFCLHEDLILKYDLLLKKEISEEERGLLERENQKYEAYAVALRELNRRLRTLKEMREFLMKKGFLLSQVEEVLDLLTKQGYLDEQVYVESYFYDRISLSKDGPLKIHQDLVDKGISLACVQKKMEEFSQEMERERIEKIVSKLAKSNKGSRLQFLQKAKYSLNQLGYHSSLIDAVLSEVEVDDADIYQREYQKLLRQLSKKYSGSELEYKIRQKLYQKGFRS